MHIFEKLSENGLCCEIYTATYIFFVNRGQNLDMGGWGLISYRGDHLRHETTVCLIDKY